MYAIVEFLKGSNKEYAVVPIVWLYNNNKMCYWPRVKTETELMKFVKEKSSYDKKWPKFPVNKIWKSSDDYDYLQQELTQILELSSTESGSSAIQVSVITNEPSYAQEVESEQDYSPERSHNEKSKRKGHKRKHKSDNYGKKKSRYSKIKSPKHQSSSSSSQSSETDENDTVDVHEKEAESPTVNKKSSKQKNLESLSNVISCRTPTVLKNITNMEPSVAKGLTELSSPRSPIQRSITGLEAIASPRSHVAKGLTELSSPRSPIQRSITGLEAIASPRSHVAKGLTELSSPRSPIQRSITGLEGITRSRLHVDCHLSERRSNQESSIITETPPGRYDRFSNSSREDFEIEVLTRLRTLDAELSQINTSLGQLSRAARFGNIQTATKPEDFPNLPLQTMEDFRNFDSLLKREVYETYFTNRLAAIGGINVRQCVMHILKFALTNKLAMEFNWAGREKKQPFQGTLMATIITAAVKIHFTDSPDATDIQISAAIKDWLKQAKHRHACQQKRDT
ncbi:uncharacterized protein LOC125499808 isoform X2 [Athalia rosae]|nr:uncharacterized protein LOC125499808 isoform X2 [Athalia rosae]